ncbi:EAL domain-containing protein [Enterobacteriaceae bacterium 4M9]|nr:EAL domain-containing protein [Enterobacteriaceae bacterium 4M9]
MNEQKFKDAGMRIVRTDINDTEHALQLVEGIRLQPLIALGTGELQGHEVLTLLAPDVQVEAFFETLSTEACLLLFFKQLEIIRRLVEPGLFFMNLPVRVFTDPDCMQRLLRVRSCYRRNVVAEVQDPEYLLTAEVAQRRVLKANVYRLRSRGWSVWLDDLTPAVSEGIKNEGFWFDGVKTCRHELARHTLPQLVCDARELGRMVLVEGIETDEELALARSSGADWGQGFLWPERTLLFRS